MEKEKAQAELWASQHIEEGCGRNYKNGGRVLPNAVESEAGLENNPRRH